MSRRGPRSAIERLRGLLVMLPWLMQRQKVRVADMAAQFSISESDLIEDLELASLCGTPPYTPFDLADLYIENGYIYVGPNKKFEQRLRLRAPEAFTLSVLASAADDIPGFSQGEELQSALEKLRKVLGKNIVDVEVESPPYLDAVTQAATSGELLEIVYWTPSRNEETQRTVAAHSVFSYKGNWYMNADDSSSGERRHFRIDRIRSLTPTGKFVDVVREPVEIPRWFADDSANTIVKARVSAEAAWIIETYPSRSVVENSDGSFDIELPVSSEHWLSRILLRAGSAITVTAPDDFVDLQQRAARQMLARYVPTNSSM
jgi:proteasome accessory factor C